MMEREVAVSREEEERETREMKSCSQSRQP